MSGAFHSCVSELANTLKTAHVIHISDCHLFADPSRELRGVCTAQTLAAVLDTAQRRPATRQMAVVTGDLTNDGETGAYELAQHLFARLNVPVYAIPGNHDVPSQMQHILTGHPIAWKRSVVAAGWHIIFLNSARPGHDEGELSEEELSALTEALAANPGMPTLIALHHQPISVATPWMDQIGLAKPKRLLKILARHPWTRGILFGHIHRPFSGHWRGIRLLGAPSTCVQFARGTPHPVQTTALPGYRWLQLHPNGQLETGITRIKRSSSIATQPEQE